MEAKEDKFKELRKETSLRMRLFVHIQMGDYDNWKNGEYLGDVKKLQQEVNWLIQEFEEFVADGSFEGFTKIDDDDYLMGATDSGLVSL